MDSSRTIELTRESHGVQMTDRRDNTFQTDVTSAMQQLIARFDRLEEKMDHFLEVIGDQRETQAELKVKVCQLETRVSGLEGHKWQALTAIVSALVLALGKIIYDLFQHHVAAK